MSDPAGSKRGSATLDSDAPVYRVPPGHPLAQGSSTTAALSIDHLEESPPLSSVMDRAAKRMRLQAESASAASDMLSTLASSDGAATQASFSELACAQEAHDDSSASLERLRQEQARVAADIEARRAALAALDASLAIAETTNAQTLARREEAKHAHTLNVAAQCIQQSQTAGGFAAASSLAAQSSPILLAAAADTVMSGGSDDAPSNLLPTHNLHRVPARHVLRAGGGSAHFGFSDRAEGSPKSAALTVEEAPSPSHSVSWFDYLHNTNSCQHLDDTAAHATKDGQRSKSVRIARRERKARAEQEQPSNIVVAAAHRRISPPQLTDSAATPMLHRSVQLEATSTRLAAQSQAVQWASFTTNNAKQHVAAAFAAAAAPLIRMSLRDRKKKSAFEEQHGSLNPTLPLSAQNFTSAAASSSAAADAQTALPPTDPAVARSLAAQMERLIARERGGGLKVPKSNEHWRAVGIWLASRDFPDVPFFLPLVDSETGMKLDLPVPYKSIMACLSPKYTDRDRILLHARVVQRLDDQGRLFGEVRYLCTDIAVSYQLGDNAFKWIIFQSVCTARLIAPACSAMVCTHALTFCCSILC
jgi:hypothetical protein